MQRRVRKYLGEEARPDFERRGDGKKRHWGCFLDTQMTVTRTSHVGSTVMV